MKVKHDWDDILNNLNPLSWLKPHGQFTGGSKHPSKIMKKSVFHSVLSHFYFGYAKQKEAFKLEKSESIGQNMK